MDRIISKWLVYVAIGLAVAYLWVHSESIASECRTLVANWWH
jgi:hypothetical protein